MNANRRKNATRFTMPRPWLNGSPTRAPKAPSADDRRQRDKLDSLLFGSSPAN